MKRGEDRDRRQPEDPLWYKDAILYELHVRAFADSNGDGMGDFRGLTAKLDYLEQLGVTAIWILPFYPSPWRDDGYDISDYTSVHPAYGNLTDFKAFLREAHRRGLKVITELVVNHTSDRHPWFERSRRAEPGSTARNMYVWSDDPQKYADARIIFKDFESSNWSWDPVANAYYWHRFFHHQPDLNFDHPRVHKALLQALDFWMEMGVDGLRLDAVPYLFEREGTNCENLPETHDFLRKLRAHVDSRFAGRMLLAEANQWPEDSIAYFGTGDECHMAFHFPVMPRLFMAIRMEDRFPVIDILQQTPAIPESCQWATFLRNHDELTLEMVTDEDRDYMYRVYAADPRARINLGIRRRLAPLLGNDRRRIELMNGLLFSLPGAPVLYYGDEIGMGDNIYLGDRNGVRTPMQWSSDRNAGFSRAAAQQLYLPVIVDAEYHYEAVNVEAQQGNPHSLLWWTRRLIALRKRHRAFSRGSLAFLYPRNHRVLAFVRQHEGETILVVANLSRFVQPAELDLSPWAGSTPVELFGRNRFPPVGSQGYPLTLGPHSFYWFALEPASDRPLSLGSTGSVDSTTVRIRWDDVEDRGWESALEGPARERLEAALPGILAARRWFGGKARTVRAVRLAEAVPLRDLGDLGDLGDRGEGASGAVLALLDVDYTESEPESYLLPLAFAAAGRAEEIAARAPQAVVARLEGDEPGILYDALFDPGFARGLLEAIARRRRFKDGEGSELAAYPTPAFRELAAGSGGDVEPSVLEAEQTNTSVAFGDRFILKLYRRLEDGTNPDLEVGRFLTEKAGFAHTPPVAGAIELRRPGRREPATVAVLQGYVRNEGDAWRHTLDALGRFIERSLTGAPVPPPTAPATPLLDLAERELPEPAREILGLYRTSAELLGERTAELHLALASPAAAETAGFAPEPFSLLYQRSLYQSLRGAAGRTLDLLAQRLPALPEPLRPAAEDLLGGRERLLGRFSALLGGKIETVRIRTHGDYHLGQVLHTGRDFVVLDFEGEPARPLSERRLKRSALRDVAGMLRSFQYAAHAALLDETRRGAVPESARGGLEVQLAAWERWAGAAFLGAYLRRSRAGGATFLPAARTDLVLLLDVYLLEKAVYELGYELDNRPDWVGIPLAGIQRILRAPDSAREGG
ncbi:MAG TPA: maltose alpha-D-glucosyltransferase [Thermoanaerobaculia bacterium]